MYLFNKTIRYDFDFRKSNLITVGVVKFDMAVTQIDGIIYNDKIEQIGIFNYCNSTLKVIEGDEQLVKQVLENLLEELDKININN